MARKKVRTDKKPEYAEAIEKAKSENRFVGDSCLGGGVDCGAFVTTLLHDSGFDKNYNYGGETVRLAQLAHRERGRKPTGKLSVMVAQLT